MSHIQVATFGVVLLGTTFAALVAHLFFFN